MKTPSIPGQGTSFGMNFDPKSENESPRLFCRRNRSIVSNYRFDPKSLVLSQEEFKLNMGYGLKSFSGTGTGTIVDFGAKGTTFSDGNAEGQPNSTTAPGTNQPQHNYAHLMQLVSVKSPIISLTRFDMTRLQNSSDHGIDNGIGDVDNKPAMDTDSQSENFNSRRSGRNRTIVGNYIFNPKFLSQEEYKLNMEIVLNNSTTGRTNPASTGTAIGVDKIEATSLKRSAETPPNTTKVLCTSQAQKNHDGVSMELDKTPVLSLIRVKVHEIGARTVKCTCGKNVVFPISASMEERKLKLDEQERRIIAREQRLKDRKFRWREVEVSREVAYSAELKSLSDISSKLEERKSALDEREKMLNERETILNDAIDIGLAIGPHFGDIRDIMDTVTFL